MFADVLSAYGKRAREISQEQLEQEKLQLLMQGEQQAQALKGAEAAGLYGQTSVAAGNLAGANAAAQTRARRLGEAVNPSSPTGWVGPADDTDINRIGRSLGLKPEDRFFDRGESGVTRVRTSPTGEAQATPVVAPTPLTYTYQDPTTGEVTVGPAPGGAGDSTAPPAIPGTPRPPTGQRRVMRVSQGGREIYQAPPRAGVPVNTGDAIVIVDPNAIGSRIPTGPKPGSAGQAAEDVKNEALLRQAVANDQAVQDTAINVEGDQAALKLALEARNRARLDPAVSPDILRQIDQEAADAAKLLEVSRRAHSLAKQEALARAQRRYPQLAPRPEPAASSPVSRRPASPAPRADGQAGGTPRRPIPAGPVGQRSRNAGVAPPDVELFTAPARGGI